VQILEIDTPSGAARLHLERPERPLALFLRGHGAGGGVQAPDLTALARALPATGCAVGLLEQPYRVAGRRAPAPARQLDAAFTAAAGAVREPDLPLVVGGRSSGARVACRTADELGAVGVLALAFPLRPPWRPSSTRLPELAAVPVPTLVVQGERDHFGSADELAALAPARAQVLAVPGADHSLDRKIPIDEITRWVLSQVNSAAPDRPAAP
jgi:predicted alpha/beta-hydrolase family hydrolase